MAVLLLMLYKELTKLKYQFVLTELEWMKQQLINCLILVKTQHLREPKKEQALDCYCVRNLLQSTMEKFG